MENPAENAQETATDDLLLADSPEDDDPLLEEPAPARQGLPPGFRMRHDRHYVDELMGMRPARASRAGARLAEPAPSPAAAPPREATDAATRLLRTAIAAVAERLDVAREHASAARRSTPTPFDRALQVEIDRASRLAHAAVALGGDLQIARRETTAGDIATRAKHAIAPLRRFSGVTWEVSVDDPAFRIGVDGNAITSGIAGALHAFADLLDSAQDLDEPPIVRVRVHGVQPRPALMIEVSTTGASLSEEAVGSLFEPTPGCHAAGIEGALLLSAAAKIARAHGGRAEARRDGDALVALFVFPRPA